VNVKGDEIGKSKGKGQGGRKRKGDIRENHTTTTLDKQTDKRKDKHTNAGRSEAKKEPERVAEEEQSPHGEPDSANQTNTHATRHKKKKQARDAHTQGGGKGRDTHVPKHTHT
jgi:hypothetical protein